MNENENLPLEGKVPPEGADEVSEIKTPHQSASLTASPRGEAPETPAGGGVLDAPPEQDDNAAGAQKGLRPLGGEAVEHSETDEGDSPEVSPLPHQSPSATAPRPPFVRFADISPAGESSPAGGSPFPDLRAHYASLRAQAEALAAEIPGFSLERALRDGDFLRLTSPAVGVSVRRAWYALHGAEREKQAERRAYDRAAAAAASSAARQREGGRGLYAPAPPAAPLDRAGREALRQRIYDAAARGEKMYP